MRAVALRILFNIRLIEWLRGSIARTFFPFERRFLEVRTVTVFACTVGSPIPQKRSNKPDKQEQGHYDGHDQVADFIAEVHENAHDIKRFCQRKDHNDALDEQ